jgi:hypothetical protein
MQKLIIEIDDKYTPLVLGILSNLKKNIIKNITIQKEEKDKKISKVEEFRRLKAKSNNQEKLTMQLATNTQDMINDNILF